jgi:hypothetical protein
MILPIPQTQRRLGAVSYQKGGMTFRASLPLTVLGVLVSFVVLLHKDKAIADYSCNPLRFSFIFISRGDSE